jgi:hypothetical protein
MGASLETKILPLSARWSSISATHTRTSYQSKMPRSNGSTSSGESASPRPSRRSSFSIDIGGKLLTNHLKHLISFRQWNMIDQTAVVNAVREACGYVSMSYQADLEQIKCVGTAYRPAELISDHILAKTPLCRNMSSQTSRPHQPPAQDISGPDRTPPRLPSQRMEKYRKRERWPKVRRSKSCTWGTSGLSGRSCCLTHQTSVRYLQL